jgi:hypothetical protein
MYATDAHICIKAATQKFSDFDRSEVEILNGKFIHQKTFKKILACDRVIITEDGIQDEITKDIYLFSKSETKFPNVEAVIPKGVNAIKEIGISPSVCMKLMKVLNVTDILSLKFNFTAENRPILITGIGENEGSLECVLMPVMLNN